jgi:hypothetical protein
MYPSLMYLQPDTENASLAEASIAFLMCERGWRPYHYLSSADRRDRSDCRQGFDPYRVTL